MQYFIQPHHSITNFVKDERHWHVGLESTTQTVKINRIAENEIQLLVSNAGILMIIRQYFAECGVFVLV